MTAMTHQYCPNLLNSQTASRHWLATLRARTHQLPGLMVLLCALFYMVAAPAQDGSFCNLARNPDAVLVITDNGTNELVGAGGKEWRGSGVIVRTRARREGSDVELLAPDAAVKHLKLQWKTALPVDWKYLGDAWERAYGD